MPLSQGVFGASGPPPNNSHFTVILGEAAQYLCVWAATGILDGAHTLQVDSGGTPLLFDQSNDPDPTLAPSMPTSAPSASTAIPASIGNSHKHAPVGAMAGGVVGGIAAILAILGVLMCLRRARRTTPPATINHDE